MIKINYNKMFFNEELVISNGEKSYTMDIELKGLDGKPDCQIGNFYHNFYFRTPHGMKYKKYTSVNRMKTAIKKVAEKQGFKVVEWIKKNNA